MADDKANASVTYTWDDMIAEFVELGGIADNIVLKKGVRGRGLFPMDPSKPILIHVPENLLLDSADIGFKDGHLCVKHKKRGRHREEEFLERFENTFSWGAGGQEDSKRVLETALALPDQVRNTLTIGFGLGDFFCGSSEQAVQDRFLKSRNIRYRHGLALLPVLELLNHSANGSTFEYEDGVTLRGQFDGEILASYAKTDPIGIFYQWGFASAQAIALSLRCTFEFGHRRIVIERDVRKRDQRGGFSVPQLTENSGQISLSYLMVGNAKFPRLSKGVFYRLMRDIDLPNYEELFDRILNFNIRAFLRLLEVLEPYEGPEITELRRVARFQLEALAYCEGTREL